VGLTIRPLSAQKSNKDSLLKFDTYKAASMSILNPVLALHSLDRPSPGVGLQLRQRLAKASPDSTQLGKEVVCKSSLGPIEVLNNNNNDNTNIIRKLT
jgi:hypothetical protein